MPVSPVNPPELAPPAANYSHATVADAPTRWLHTSGVVATQADGTVPDGIAAQVEVVWANLAAIVAAAGMTMRDVASITTYVVQGQDLAVVMAARDRAMDGHLPASTLLPVVALAQPAWLVEIAVVACR